MIRNMGPSEHYLELVLPSPPLSSGCMSRLSINSIYMRGTVGLGPANFPCRYLCAVVGPVPTARATQVDAEWQRDLSTAARCRQLHFSPRTRHQSQRSVHCRTLNDAGRHCRLLLCSVRNRTIARVAAVDLSRPQIFSSPGISCVAIVRFWAGGDGVRVH